MLQRSPLFWVFLVFPLLGFGQVDVNLLKEGSWVYQSRLDTRTDDLFKPEQKTQLQFLNEEKLEINRGGSTEQGSWSIKGRELNFSFDQKPGFRVIRIDSTELVLAEVSATSVRPRYRYYFRNGEIIEPLVQSKRTSSKKTTTPKKKETSKPPIVDTDVRLPEISIELMGGDFYEGADPVIRNAIHIKSNGRLIWELKRRKQGLSVTKKNLGRQQVEQLARYMANAGFFEWESYYPCKDSLCQVRLQQSPKPIPLQIALTYQGRRQTILLPIHDAKFVDYPPKLDILIDRIRKVALP
jgi:hypothetical protein